MASDIEIKEAIEKVFKIDKLKEEQRAIAVAALKKKDCIAISPTGYGKSFPYQMFIPLRRMLQIPGADHTNFVKFFVCSPIIALMQNQMDRLNSIPKVKAVYKGRCYFVFIEGSGDRTKMPMQLPLKFQAFIIYASPIPRLFYTFTTFTGESLDSEQIIAEGKFDNLIASPEALVGSSVYRQILKGFKVDTIVVDESHTLYRW